MNPRYYQVVLATDHPAERAAFVQWLSEHRAAVQALSDNFGCGCCVDIFELALAPGGTAPPHSNEANSVTASTFEGPDRDRLIEKLLEAD